MAPSSLPSDGASTIPSAIHPLAKPNRAPVSDRDALAKADRDPVSDRDARAALAVLAARRWGRSPSEAPSGPPGLGVRRSARSGASRRANAPSPASPAVGGRDLA